MARLVANGQPIVQGEGKDDRPRHQSPTARDGRAEVGRIHPSRKEVTGMAKHGKRKTTLGKGTTWSISETTRRAMKTITIVAWLLRLVLIYLGLHH